MENISEYIPLLIIVGSIILSAITGSKKKKKEVSHETRIPGIPPAETQKHPVESRAGSKIKKEIQPDIKHTSAQNKSIPVFKTSPSHIKPSSNKDNVLLESDEETSQVFIDVSDLDEVKKAIIYSEIFTRKEY